MTARGIRNNNPGNIEYGPWAQSHGATGSDGRFAIFPSAEAGIAAMQALLQNYQNQGLTTVRDMIGRWAPTGDGNDVNSYANAVARAMGISPDTPFSLSDPALASAMIGGMVQHENGSNPYTSQQYASALSGGTQLAYAGTPQTSSAQQAITAMSSGSRSQPKADLSGAPRLPTEDARQHPILDALREFAASIANRQRGGRLRTAFESAQAGKPADQIAQLALRGSLLPAQPAAGKAIAPVPVPNPDPGSRSPQGTTAGAGTGTTLYRGMTSPEVATLQQYLGIEADGIFGPQTEAAVRDFQRRAGIAVDGIVGPQTQRAMTNIAPVPLAKPGGVSGGAANDTWRAMFSGGAVNDRMVGRPAGQSNDTMRSFAGAANDRMKSYAGSANDTMRGYAGARNDTGFPAGLGQISPAPVTSVTRSGLGPARAGYDPLLPGVMGMPPGIDLGTILGGAPRTGGGARNDVFAPSGGAPVMPLGTRSVTTQSFGHSSAPDLFLQAGRPPIGRFAHSPGVLPDYYGGAPAIPSSLSSLYDKAPMTGPALGDLSGSTRGGSGSGSTGSGSAPPTFGPFDDGYYASLARFGFGSTVPKPGGGLLSPGDAEDGGSGIDNLAGLLSMPGLLTATKKKPRKK